MMNSSTPDDIEEAFIGFAGEDEGIDVLVAQDAENATLRYVMFICGVFLLVVPFIWSALVCYTVFKLIAFRTRTNYLLVNFFIASSLFCATFGFELCVEFFTVSFHYIHFFLFLLQLVLFSATCFMTMLLAFDWYSLAHWHSTFTKFAKYYKWIIGFFYSSTLVIFILMHRISMLQTIFIYVDILSYLTTLITVIAWNLMRLRRTYTTEIMQTYYAFASATMYILMWVPFIVILILHFVISNYWHRLDWYQDFDNILIWLSQISVCAAIASPGLIAFFLTRWDTQFRMGFGCVLKRNFSRNNDLDGHVAYVNYSSSECFEEDVKLS